MTIRAAMTTTVTKIMMKTTGMTKTTMTGIMSMTPTIMTKMTTNSTMTIMIRGEEDVEIPKV